MQNIVFPVDNVVILQRVSGKTEESPVTLTPVDDTTANLTQLPERLNHRIPLFGNKLNPTHPPVPSSLGISDINDLLNNANDNIIATNAIAGQCQAVPSNIQQPINVPLNAASYPVIISHQTPICFTYNQYNLTDGGQNPFCSQIRNQQNKTPTTYIAQNVSLVSKDTSNIRNIVSRFAARNPETVITQQKKNIANTTAFKAISPNTTALRAIAPKNTTHKFINIQRDGDVKQMYTGIACNKRKVTSLSNTISEKIVPDFRKPASAIGKQTKRLPNDQVYGDVSVSPDNALLKNKGAYLSFSWIPGDRDVDRQKNRHFIDMIRVSPSDFSENDNPQNNSPQNATPLLSIVEDDQDDFMSLCDLDIDYEYEKLCPANDQQERSSKEDNLSDIKTLKEHIRGLSSAKGLAMPSDEVITLLSHALNERLKNVIEKLVIIATHRTNMINLDKRHQLTKDVGKQLSFLRELDKVVSVRNNDMIKENIMIAASKSLKHSSVEEIAVAKEQLHNIRRSESNVMRRRVADETALIASKGKRRKLNEPLVKATGESCKTVSTRPRIKTLTTSDLLFIMNEEKVHHFSKIVYKWYAN